MTEPARPEVSPVVVAELRAVCLGLPEAVEEEAWVGTRWRVRSKTFAHVVRIVGGHPPAYAREAGDDDATVVTFRSSGDELEALANAGPPFFRPPWAPNVVGMTLGPDVDWAEVAELVTDSYCLLAPRALAARVARPG
jgi:predicted DNA-binding protein (MmcQ/YjbR family)